ncbi:MAG: aldolase/citrate lyase family protein [Synergistaceae bacterium]|nr:aldolase/citrate lyase family protein [Synergistaceae bacterium]
MINKIKQMVEKGQKAFGTFSQLGGSMAADCLGIAGLDFFVVDTEHGPCDVESTLPAILAADRRGITPFVRIKDPTRPSVLKMLDIGAKGLIVPCIQTKEEVERLVEYAKYYPMGRRGFAFTLAGAFGYADFARDTQTYFETSNNQTLLFPQCETRGCLDNIEEIASMEGVDGILIGPYDLSVALGKPAQMENPELLDAIGHILKTCKANGKISMIFTGSAGAVKALFDQGFDCVACGLDAVFLIEAYKSLIAQLKG